MNHTDKKAWLSQIIQEKVLPMIVDDYALYGLPYYNNIGDTLIWNGELELLKKSRHRCVGTCGWNAYPCTKLPQNVIILITGGGYFGDLWRYGWEQVLKGIEPNRDNRIIILPNTIFYQDWDLLQKDSRYLSQFPNLTICARDNVSYEFAKNNFSNDVMLVPDMAFCMNNRLIEKYARQTPSRDTLLFMRNDKEKPEFTDHDLVNAKMVDVHDWLPMETQIPAESRFNRVLNLLRKTGHLNKHLPDLIETAMYRHIYRPMMTKIGLKQLSEYQQIITTRLHAMILGVMLGRDIKMVDNKFGKLSSFYDTWLIDCDNVTPLYTDK